MYEGNKMKLNEIKEGMQMAEPDSLPAMMSKLKMLQKELIDYKKVGDNAKLTEIEGNIRELNNTITLMKKGIRK